MPGMRNVLGSIFCISLSISQDSARVTFLSSPYADLYSNTTDLSILELLHF